MLDNFIYLFLFVGALAAVITILSPLLLLMHKRDTLQRQQRELEHLMLKEQRALEIYQELKAQGRL